MRILNYMKPSTREEAYELISHGGTVLGGGAWMKLMPKTVDSVVDISGLGLEGIRQAHGVIRMGSMTTLRVMETDPLLTDYLDGMVSKAGGQIMGVQVRNLATLGGTVAGRLGFSDLLTPLLAADARLVFYKHGEISLETYLADPFKDKDLLLEVVLDQKDGRGTYKSLKKTSLDFSVVGIAAVYRDKAIRLSVGARPGVAALAKEAMAILNGQSSPDDTVMEKALEAMVTELKFGGNSRASEGYRTAVAKTLAARSIKEVMA